MLFRSDLPDGHDERLSLNRLLLAERRLLLLSRLSTDSVATPRRPALAELFRRVRAWLNGGRE